MQIYILCAGIGLRMDQGFTKALLPMPTLHDPTKSNFLLYRTLDLLEELRANEANNIFIVANKNDYATINSMIFNDPLGYWDIVSNVINIGEPKSGVVDTIIKLEPKHETLFILGDVVWSKLALQEALNPKTNKITFCSDSKGTYGEIYSLFVPEEQIELFTNILKLKSLVSYRGLSVFVERKKRRRQPIEACKLNDLYFHLAAESPGDVLRYKCQYPIEDIDTFNEYNEAVEKLEKGYFG